MINGRQLTLGLLMTVCLTANAASPIYVQRDIPFAEDSRIAGKIKRECTDLGLKLSSFLVEYAAEKGIEVVQVDEVQSGDAGVQLVIEITDAVSRGNAFIGHSKYMEAHAELFSDGQSIGDMDYSRDSMGGFGAGFKG